MFASLLEWQKQGERRSLYLDLFEDGGLFLYVRYNGCLFADARREEGRRMFEKRC